MAETQISTYPIKSFECDDFQERVGELWCIEQAWWVAASWLIGGDRQPLPAVQQDPPWNFQHKMGGHMPGINHHSVPGTGLPKIWPWVLSFCRGHFCILEGLIIYIYIFFRDSFPRCSCSNILGYLGTCKKSCCHFVETFSQDFWDDRESSYSLL